MRQALQDFYGNYSSEEETGQTIHDLYEKTGYVIDTHTAVAAGVYGKYKAETGDRDTDGHRFYCKSFQVCQERHDCH